MTISQALRKLFTAKGGSASTVKNKSVAGIINEIAKIAGEDSALPAVTADDNGDVLTVVEGEWGKAAPSAGGVMVVTFSAAMEDDELVITADKTLSELLEALEDGMICEGRLATAEATTILRTLDYTEESIRFYFKDNDDVTWVQIDYGADGISYDGGSGGEE